MVIKLVNATTHNFLYSASLRELREKNEMSVTAFLISVFASLVIVAADSISVPALSLSDLVSLQVILSILISGILILILIIS